MARFHATIFFLLSLLILPFASAAPAPPFAAIANGTSMGNSTTSGPNGTRNDAAASSWWLANIQRQGTVPFGSGSGYNIYRNVKDFGAKGDGSTDDTVAINNAISSGNRCGYGCDSSTTTPALVYFPPGTYVVSKPIIQYYYTQLVGDAVTPPTLKAAAGFQGIAVIDSDPYNSGGSNWYTNQNNFFRQVRNFVIDLRSMPSTAGTGIHWQVAQATSLQNIVFNMIQGGGNNKQQGIFMDNGSGGWMSDLVFNGGNYGAFFGNQQFTSRNLTFNGCSTAIFMNWDWTWSFKSLNINNCGVGIDMANGGSDQTVGAVLVQDSKFVNTPVGIRSSFGPNTTPNTGGTLIIDNCDFRGSQSAVAGPSGNQVLAGGGIVSSWGQGRQYTGNSGARIQQTLTAPNKPASLLSGGNIYERAKPQYQNVPASSFVSVKSKGAKGDGSTDDTQAIQNAMNGLQSGQILYFDHGAYIVSSTIKVPANIRIVGEMWPLIMAKGSAFQNAGSLVPVFQVGTAGQTGAAEIQDLIFETVGPQAGATLVQWNSGASSQGANGIWDTHFRIGGTAGTALQSNTCTKNPSVQANANPACIGAGLLLHITKTASLLVENSWAWVADHELDLSDHNQINIFNGRGILVEATGGTWLYGTSSEHSVLYNYNINNAQNVYMSMIQAETAYFQPNPPAPAPFTTKISGDPSFGNAGSGDAQTWGLVIGGSSNVLIYGTGLYSFFSNYNQNCLSTGNCQDNMVSVSNSQNVNIYGLTTKAATNMLTYNGQSAILNADNMNNFCSTVAHWSQ